MLVSILAYICLCQSFFNSNNNAFQKLAPEFQKKRLLAMKHSEIRLLNQSTQNQVQLENQK